MRAFATLIFVALLDSSVYRPAVPTSHWAGQVVRCKNGAHFYTLIRPSRFKTDYTAAVGMTEIPRATQSLGTKPAILLNLGLTATATLSGQTRRATGNGQQAGWRPCLPGKKRSTLLLTQGQCATRAGGAFAAASCVAHGKKKPQARSVHARTHARGVAVAEDDSRKMRGAAAAHRTPSGSE